MEGACGKKYFCSLSIFSVTYHLGDTKHRTVSRNCSWTETHDTAAGTSEVHELP
jgi:hypothetical protein